MGNQKLSFNEIFTIYRNRVYGYALTICKSDYAAEEVTQEIFIKLWGSLELLDNVLNLDAYIFRVAKNASLNYLRKAAYDSRLLAELLKQSIPEENNVDAFVLTSEYNTLLAEALKSMSPQRRLVYEMSRKQGLTHQEIAEKLDLSQNTVKNHLVSALKIIRDHLIKNGLSISALTFLFFD